MRVDEQLLRREQLGLRRVAEVVIRYRKLLRTHAPHKYSRTAGLRTVGYDAHAHAPAACAQRTIAAVPSMAARTN